MITQQLTLWKGKSTIATMRYAIIFDLSEVLISGLQGVENILATELSCSHEKILPSLGGRLLHDLCCDHINEEYYLSNVIANEGWKITPDQLKNFIRLNFHQRVSGMEEILIKLEAQHDLFLLSDHAREWISYIKGVHPFLDIFKEQYYSFDLKQLKKEPSTFTIILRKIRYNSKDCIFIDDNKINIDSSKLSGITGIHFHNAEQLWNELRKIGLL